jgi:hypothetical protein
VELKAGFSYPSNSEKQFATYPHLAARHQPNRIIDNCRRCRVLFYAIELEYLENQGFNAHQQYRFSGSRGKLNLVRHWKHYINVFSLYPQRQTPLHAPRVRHCTTRSFGFFTSNYTSNNVSFALQ